MNPGYSFDSLSPVWLHSTEAIIVRGEGCYLYDVEGRKYLDFTSGIGVTGTGHCHPRVVQAIQEQASQLIFGQINCVFPQATLAFSHALRSAMPEGIDCFLFSNSGAEATEGAVKLAKAATGRPNIVAFQGSFHGRTALTMALTSSKTSYRTGYQPLPAGIFFTPYPYAYHYGWSEKQTIDFCKKELEHLFHSQTAPSETAALLVEPVLGEGGYVPAPPEFLKFLRDLCDRHGILLIIDEIQSGFGRTGRYWAHQHADVRPDILLMAKCIASGMPLSAVAASKSLMAKWQPGAHGGTYGGGNAVVMAAAMATLRIIEDEGLVENAARMGTHLMKRLRGLAAKHSSIGDVRGLGCMAGVELRRDLPEPSKRVTAIKKYCAANGLLLLSCGTYGNVIRWIPPLIVRESQIDEAVSIFDGALAANP